MSDRVAERPVTLARADRGHIDGKRALGGLILVAWSAFFSWLWISGEMTRYLGPRTYWVVPFGAIALGVAGLLHVFTLRSPTPQPGPSAVDMVGAVMLIVPLIAVATVPNADLGALAASRKSTGGAAIAEALTTGAVDPVEDPTFRDIAYAEESQRYAEATGVTGGTSVELTGFVDESADAPKGTIQLTRFYVSCCAADAIPYSVAVDPNGQTPAQSQTDSWATVSGKLEPREGRLVVVVDRFEAVPEPEEPYLY
ncbi:MAG TPA: TIGR03943 family protein [Actinomycetota bacterium]|nr:TIGR03943 family protein [Actinomycetota bacterium]